MNLNWLSIPTLLVALLLFAAGQYSIRHCLTAKRKLALSALWFVLGIPGFLSTLYYLHLFDSAIWFYELRSLPFIELTAAGAGLFAGALAELIKTPRLFSRSFLIAVLCIGIAIPYLKPVLAPAPLSDFREMWDGDVCLQSTLSSCGPASAATIFRKLGIPISERDIAKECFTYLGGTENWYITRAFRSRGCTVNYRFVKGFAADLNTPAIAGVKTGGMGHFIAILDKIEENYITGDPLIGRQVIPENHITNVFDFTGFFIEVDICGKKK